MIKTIPTGALETNCYIVQTAPGGTLYVIDPGDNAATLLEACRELEFSSALILLTHGHFDHIGAAEYLRTHLLPHPVACFVNAEDKALLYDPENCFPPYLPPVENPPRKLVHSLEDHPEIKLLSTPGHTPGGVSFYFPALRAVFTGDALFAASVGRTDFPGGDPALLIASIKQNLLTLPDDTAVYPGHGRPTTIGREKAVNSYLK